MISKDEKLLKGFSEFLDSYSYGKCIDEETMALLVDNKLKKQEKDQVLKHILVCSDCYEKYVLLKNMERDSKNLKTSTIVKIVAVFFVFAISLYYFFQYKDNKIERFDNIKQEKKVISRLYKSEESVQGVKPLKPSSKSIKRKKVINQKVRKKKAMKRESVSKDKEEVVGIIGNVNKVHELELKKNDVESIKMLYSKRMVIKEYYFLKQPLKVKNLEIFKTSIKNCNNKVYDLLIYVNKRGIVDKINSNIYDDCFKKLYQVLKKLEFYPYKINDKYIDVKFNLKLKIEKKLKILK